MISITFVSNINILTSFWPVSKRLLLYALQLHGPYLQEEYTETWKGNIQAGLKILVHDQSDPPLMDTLGSAVPPGFYSFMGIRKDMVCEIQNPHCCIASFLVYIIIRWWWTWPNNFTTFNNTAIPPPIDLCQRVELSSSIHIFIHIIRKLQILYLINRLVLLDFLFVFSYSNLSDMSPCFFTSVSILL